MGLREYINTRLLHPTSTGISNIPSLDGIRGIAIIMVVYCHFFAHASDNGDGFPLEFMGERVDDYLISGADGVRLFFVLSAFLLTLPYIRHHVYGGSPPSMTRFFKRRVYRIIPAYFFMLAAYSALMAISLQPAVDKHFTISNIAANAVFMQPFLLFDSGVYPEYIPGTWSLAAEVHFYLVLPFIARYFTSIKKAAALTLSIMVLCALYRYVINHRFGPTGFGLAHNVAAHFDLFALGMFAALIYFKRAAGEITLPGWWAYVMLAFGGAVYWWRFNGGPTFIKDYEILLELAFFLVVLGVSYGGTFIKRALEWSPLRYIGLVSYSMFLINLSFVWYALNPAQKYFGITEPADRFGFNMIIGFPALVALSTLTYLYIERPFLIKKRAAVSVVVAEQPSVEVSPPR